MKKLCIVCYVIWFPSRFEWDSFAPQLLGNSWSPPLHPATPIAPSPRLHSFPLPQKGLSPTCLCAASFLCSHQFFKNFRALTLYKGGNFCFQMPSRKRTRDRNEASTVRTVYQNLENRREGGERCALCMEGVRVWAPVSSWLTGRMTI